ncbi:MAG: histidinol dehydrogenase [Chloroflexi bacterium]|nr:MAG: histidinol dehydrogenase [Chloroflexota bacterium]MBL1192900.1 histidinol dehydrogenase [Chloroflexota bacterium]NOH10192.1 histidinol dehydrogenase [Chloroflexota bacterium]
MINIYDLKTAQKTILKRPPLTMMDFPDDVIEITEGFFGPGTTPPSAVTEILRSVRDDGDDALRHWSRTFDKVEVEDFRVPAEQFRKAFDGLAPSLQTAMQKSAERIRAFHEKQPLPDWRSDEMGGTLGQRVTAIERVGIYVPGGTAPLPSSLLMSVIPAQVAGVKRIVICTPPEAHPSILAAAYLCGCEEVYQVGGAQAIAAMAFGTDSIPRVDKITGAGNLYVTLAKQQVYGTVGLDNLAGPTETMVIADSTANPGWVAADLLAQAEHDVLASSILLTPDEDFAKSVQTEVVRQLPGLSRAEIIKTSMAQLGGIVLVPDLEVAAELANAYAAEHLCLSVAEPQVLADQINNAGGFFMGEGSFEVLGDYVAGPSHVMPTGGTARFASPLNVMDFVKISSIIALDKATSKALSPLAAEFARSEQLTAHANAAEIRLEDANE